MERQVSDIKSRRYCIFLKENMLILVKLNSRLPSTYLCLGLVFKGSIQRALGCWHLPERPTEANQVSLDRPLETTSQTASLSDPAVVPVALQLQSQYFENHCHHSCPLRLNEQAGRLTRRAQASKTGKTQPLTLLGSLRVGKEQRKGPMARGWCGQN